MIIRLVKWKRADSFIHEKIEKKTCSKCKKEKSRKEFSASARAYDGISTECRQCAAEREKAKRQMKKQDPFLKIYV